ncbi:hypothetical protein NDI52_28975 [Leptolyngbya sp. PL-A3]|uniref:hypothetical protein n=1 Tax=Leptolyngbya sp. PL-A3 TaxID=2933911 RepID=UPI0032983BDB
MNFSDIKAIQQIAESGLDPHSALVQQAGDRILQNYHGSLMLPLVATLGSVGYCLSILASAPLAIAVGLVGGMYMVDKVRRGERAFDDIENGRIERYLNESQRRVLAQLNAAGSTSIATTAEPKTIDTAAIPSLSPIAPPPISKNWSELQWQLWQRLVADCPDMRFVLMGKLVVVSGPQQCGKSSLASAIAYLRSYLLGWPTIAVTPHRDGQKIFAGVVVGAGGDFDAIQAFYSDLVENLRMGGDRQSLVIDELTQYSNGHEELGQSLVRTALSESDKHGIAPILINHARTLSGGFAGIKGVRDLLDSSAIQLTRQYGETDWGEQVRSAQVKMLRPGHGEVLLTIPDWLWLPELQKQYAITSTTPEAEAVTAPATAPSEATQQSDEQVNPFQLTPEMLERLYQASSAQSNVPIEEAKDERLDGLPRELRAIVEFAHRRGDWITARDARSGIRLLKTTQVSTAIIRGYFRQLAVQEIGSVDGEGEFLRYRC